MRNRELVVAYPLIDRSIDQFVLMGLRQRDPWKGKLSGFGGNVEEEDKSPEDGQVRELWQEARLIVDPNSLQKMAEFVVKIEDREPKILHVYILEKFSGRWENTTEMHPKLFSLYGGMPPAHAMIDGDDQWVPRILCKEKLFGTIFRDRNFKLIKAEIYPEPGSSYLFSP
jgi:8-oxo-dGTP pyrophosphatase MutT (NUDIX family)